MPIATAQSINKSSPRSLGEDSLSSHNGCFGLSIFDGNPAIVGAALEISAAKWRELKTGDNRSAVEDQLPAGDLDLSVSYNFLKVVAFEYAFLIDRLK